MLKVQVLSVESEVPKVKYKMVKFQVLVKFQKVLFINVLLKSEIKPVEVGFLFWDSRAGRRLPGGDSSLTHGGGGLTSGGNYQRGHENM